MTTRLTRQASWTVGAAARFEIGHGALVCTRMGGDRYEWFELFRVNGQLVILDLDRQGAAKIFRTAGY